MEQYVSTHTKRNAPLPLRRDVVLRGAGIVCRIVIEIFVAVAKRTGSCASGRGDVKEVDCIAG
jgi:hypothetical protein